ncbi:endolytic transglycosylase MltG [Thermodesulfobacteriota bacterium]
MNPEISKKTIAIIITGIFFIVVAGIIAGTGLYLTRPATDKGKDQVVTVKEGMALKEISNVLEQRGLIRNKLVFMAWARLMGYSRKVKAGEYRLNPSMAPIRIMEVLTRGVILTYTVTIPEGFSIKQIADVFSEQGLAPRYEFIAYALKSDSPSKHGIESPSLEGYLYPDTYIFARGLSVPTIINVMVGRFKEVITPLNDMITRSGMSLNELVTLASIIEKETGKAEERPLIASVFLNRLRKRMRLESDPTVIYGIKDFSGNLKKKDLSTHTPYNTYLIRALPPGPIASPGLASLTAVLNPDDTDFLYFVSKNDGSHHFSKTLEEHNRAVYKYQKKRK